jgi:hypothetical protein
MEPTMEAGVEPSGEARSPLGPVVKIDQGRIREPALRRPKSECAKVVLPDD